MRDRDTRYWLISSGVLLLTFGIAMGIGAVIRRSMVGKDTGTKIIDGTTSRSAAKPQVEVLTPPPPTRKTEGSIGISPAANPTEPEPSQPRWTDRVTELPGVSGSRSSGNVKVIPTAIRVEQNDTRITFLVDGSDSRDGQICPDSEKNTFLLDNQGKRYKFLDAHWSCRQIANGEKFSVDETYEKLDDDVVKVSLFFDNVKMDFNLDNRVGGISASSKNLASVSREVLQTSSSTINVHGTLLSVEKIEVGPTDTKVFFKAVGTGSDNQSICHQKTYGNSSGHLTSYRMLTAIGLSSSSISPKMVAAMLHLVRFFGLHTSMTSSTLIRIL